MTSIMEIKEQSDRDVKVLQKAVKEIKQLRKQLAEARELLKETYRFLPAVDAYRFGVSIGGEELAVKLIKFLRNMEK